MDSLSVFIQTILGFLLSLLTLIVNFCIAALQLILQFAQSIVGLVH